ncbi:GGDEF domain-containing protein [Pseudoxanthomonas broegbernensis]|uniref:diguanylate cyclase n=1 Tax=Pseudoxanthomonas broegbernensis TaxID=83619 RepID=A0A7V8K638_9GAMM|nr:GGDEF domain-containing protein [Pseudoxanthomonas broegbernensis]KAF1684646.1 GGDEF domain-containing protein [Pseudoxanthomonas broegbernensis]MBB6063482.1 diguanylate cyclase (GGDEF)-like protein [Pseudoxanthomonas broegbernensis]
MERREEETDPQLAGYLEHVRAVLQGPTLALQALAISLWCVSLAFNPQVERGATPATVAMLAALLGICVYKGWKASVLRWRVGNILYAMLLASAFRMMLSMMVRPQELLVLPVAILVSLGFASVVPLRRDYLLILAAVWAILMSGHPGVDADSLDPENLAILVAASILVALGLNHAVVTHLRATFRLKEDFRRLAETDALTGLPNRRALLARLDEACAADGRQARHFALLDLDDFKDVNDRFGHDAGDAVLQALAGDLRRLPHAFAGRLGGEEFGVIFDGADGEEVGALLERMLGDARRGGMREGGFSFSAGVVRTLPGEPAVDVLRRADEAMYQAKRMGKRRVVRAGMDAGRGAGWAGPALRVRCDPPAGGGRHGPPPGAHWRPQTWRS